MSETTSVPASEPDAQPASQRRQSKYQLEYQRWGAAALALALLIAGGLWVLDRLGHVHISDARIAATMVSVSARVPGWLETVAVEEGQRIDKGALIATIDRREAELLLAEADAQVAALEAEAEQLAAQRALTAATVRTRIARSEAEHLAAESAAHAAQAELTRAESEWQRATPMLEREIISRELWEQKQSSHEQARQNHALAQARLAAAAAAVDEARAGKKELGVIDSRLRRIEAEAQEAAARRDTRRVALSDHRIVSPIAGVVDETFADAGEYVSTGRQILVMHDPERIWISANVKETDVRHLRPGAKAGIHVDAYPDRDFEGVVRRVGNATTSQFALLPDPSPSGNFTKITQRVEVRIDLPQHGDLLKPGMMVEVEIDI